VKVKNTWINTSTLLYIFMMRRVSSPLVIPSDVT
jgi:hypothetical protein